jgi:perosamine synthetase
MPVRAKPFPPRPPRFGFEEIQGLTSALQRNELWYWHDNSIVEAAAKSAAQKFGSPFCVATSSGTASLHVAIAAARLSPGTEVITTPITDAGTINAILYQNLIPVFADVDPDSCVPTVDQIAAVMTERTGAVVVVHLTGSPVDLDPIVAMCAERGLTLIEDCAQGLGATYRGKSIGTFGRFGCYSLNDQKHITSGEGGFVIMQQESDYFLCHNYADKYYDRHKQGVRLDALAPNYRMSELDGAMFTAQMNRLDSIVERRSASGAYLDAEFAKIPGLIPQRRTPDTRSVFFFYLLRIDSAIIKCSRDEFLAQLEAEGIPARGAYVTAPIYRSPYFLKRSFFPGGIWPAQIVSGEDYDYSLINLPGAEVAVATGISLVLHEGFERADLDDYVAAFDLVASRNR